MARVNFGATSAEVDAHSTGRDRCWLNACKKGQRESDSRKCFSTFEAIYRTRIRAVPAYCQLLFMLNRVKRRGKKHIRGAKISGGTRACIRQKVFLPLQFNVYHAASA